MLLSDFDYTLPPELIAQEPAQERDASRLLVLGRRTGEVSHRSFRDLSEYLRAGDVLVVNDTRVFPARLTGHKAGTGGAVEALLVKRTGEKGFEAMVRGRLREGARLVFGGRLKAVVGKDFGGGRRALAFDCDDLDAALAEAGRMPLPPYIKDAGRDEPRDRERYQTVYASRTGAVAAPTAGLHFTPGLLDAVKVKGVSLATVTLHVGPGTFLPVKEEVVERHVMHEEEYEVSHEAAEAINSARANGGRVVAVGTTSARTLESASDADGHIRPGRGSTGIFIYPGYRFRAVDALVTNFHLPKSTLIMLVCAFAGMPPTLAAYGRAVEARYRFFSYGDAMLII